MSARSGVLSPFLVLGVSPCALRSVHVLDEHQLLLASGHLALLQHTEGRDQQLLPASAPVCCLAHCAARRLIAVAEATKPVAQVALFDSASLKRRKVLAHAELASDDIRAMAFSSDGRLLAVQGGAPDYNLVVWNLEKAAKTLFMAASGGEGVAVNAISFCLSAQNVLMVMGRGSVKLYRVVEGQLKGIPLNLRMEQANFVACGWMEDDSAVVATAAGEVLFLENFELKGAVLPAAPDEPLVPITTLITHSKGFVTASELEIRVYEHVEANKDEFAYTRSIPVNDTNGEIAAIALNHTEETVFCVTSSHQVYTVPFISNDPFKEQAVAQNYLTAHFHRPSKSGDAAVTGLDTCYWKPLLVSIGRDRHLKIWHINDKRLELDVSFPDEPLCVAFHPSGLSLLVGFLDRLVLYAVLLNELQVVREFNVRSATIVKYSNGGQYFAVSAGSTLYVFHSTSGRLITLIRIPQGRFKHMNWLMLDKRLLTIRSDGRVDKWDVATGASLGEYSEQLVSFTCGVGNMDGHRVIVATSDAVLKDVAFNGEEGNDHRISLTGAVSNMLLLSGDKTLIVSTAEADMPGNIIVCPRLPHLTAPSESLQIHSAPITAMCRSPEGQFLYTADANGVICVSFIDSDDDNTVSRDRELTDHVDEVLVRKADLQEQQGTIQRLSDTVQELITSNEYQLRMKDRENSTKVADISKEFKERLEQEEQKIVVLQKDKAHQEEVFRGKLIAMKTSNHSELEQLEKKYASRLEAEAQRQQSLVETTEKTRADRTNELSLMVEAHRDQLHVLTHQYEEVLLQQLDEQKMLHESKEDLKMEYDRQKMLIEEDADMEIGQLKHKYEDRIKTEEEIGIRLLGEHGIIKQQLKLLTKEADQLSDDIRKLQDKEGRFLETTRNLERDIQTHKKDIRERDETLTEKDRRIFDLKKKNQELEKFKFVLDYKIKELKQQIAPREVEIGTLRQQIEEMDMELEQYHRSNMSLTLMIEELKLKLKGATHEADEQDNRIAERQAAIQQIRRTLQEIGAKMDNVNEVKSEIVQLFQTHVLGDDSPGSSDAAISNPQKEYNRQRDLLERNMDSLRRTVATDARIKETDLSRLTRENVMLTTELNDLRREHQHLSSLNQAQDLGLVDADALGDVFGWQSKNKTTPTPPTQNRSTRNHVRGLPLRSSSANSGQLSSRRRDSRPQSEGDGSLRREVAMQMQQIQVLEQTIKGLCRTAGISIEEVFASA